MAATDVKAKAGINKVVADRLEELAHLLELQEANPFRARAYRAAATTVRTLARSVADILEHELTPRSCRGKIASGSRVIRVPCPCSASPSIHGKTEPLQLPFFRKASAEVPHRWRLFACLSVSCSRTAARTVFPAPNGFGSGAPHMLELQLCPATSQPVPPAELRSTAFQRRPA